eukprot:Seg3858.8 transcript_id=Seg3858.8/GoldUCD/mRNA.D3Y31 product="Peptidase M20 domain-containing protein 2" protein_id=Seg3858.8/GoldUCD/D3Y31
MSDSSTLLKLIETGKSAIDSSSAALNEISQKIWENPELGFEETHAHATLTSYFEKEGFQVFQKTPIETAFIAKYGHEDGVKVGVMCEYDSLPGIGHACGHNLIAEAGVAAAIGLKAILVANPDIKAQVVAYGTPAEEGGGGKVIMIEKGCFADMDFCMMSHPAPVNAMILSFLAVSQLKIVYNGKEAHAAACPWLGKNALDAAVQCYNNVSMLRHQMLPSCRIHGVITDGGVKPNIIPQRSELEYYVRGPTVKERDELKERLISCANAAAIATGCTVEITFPGYSYADIKPAKILNNIYQKHAESLGVTFPDFKNRPGPEKDFAGSTDMGNVSYIKPSIHPMYRIGNAINHTKEFTAVAGLPAAQKPTLDSAKAMMMTAIEVLTNSDLLKKIKEEFEQT